MEIFAFAFIDDNTNVYFFIMTLTLHNLQSSGTLFALG